MSLQGRVSETKRERRRDALLALSLTSSSLLTLNEHPSLNLLSASSTPEASRPWRCCRGVAAVECLPGAGPGAGLRCRCSSTLGSDDLHVDAVESSLEVVANDVH